MAAWLFKEEPEHYSFDDLCRDRSTLWEGVTNNLARQNLRKIKRGDRIFYYHTGKQKAVVGEMRAVKNAQSVPTDDDPKAVVVKVEPVRRLAEPVTLTMIKGDALLTDWELVRLPRLSVLPVSDEQWRRVKELSESSK
jgi:predicted RNA-binding protein with PUA-like domain